MESRPAVIVNGQGEHLRLRPPARSGEVCIKVDLRNTGSTRFAMGTQVLVPGGRIPVHLHETQDEILFVHRGAVSVTVGEETAEIGEGGTVFVPAGVWHGVENGGPDPATLVWFISPPGLEEMFRDIGGAPGEEAVPLTDDGFAEIVNRHGMRLR